jgi:hypothetical protein
MGSNSFQDGVWVGQHGASRLWGWAGSGHVLSLADPPSFLQKVYSHGSTLLLADEFQKLFDEIDKTVIKEVIGTGLYHLPAWAAGTIYFPLSLINWGLF